MFDETRILLHDEEEGGEEPRTPTNYATLACVLTWLVGCLLLGIFLYDGALLS